MRVVFKDKMLIVVPDDADEETLIDDFTAHREKHVLLLQRSGCGMQLFDLGDEDSVCNTPINITSLAPPPLDLISNFANTPFVLDERFYASIEGFWQGLKFAEAEDRARVAALFGSEAKMAGATAPATETFDYNGNSIRAGTFEHWQLMRRACWAKFSQNEAARKA